MEGSSLSSLMIITEFSREQLRPQSAPNKIAQQTDPFCPSHTRFAFTQKDEWGHLTFNTLSAAPKHRIKSCQVSINPMQHTTNIYALEKRSVRAFEGKQIDGDFHTEGFGGETNGPARRCYTALEQLFPLITAAERLKIKRAEGKTPCALGLQRMGAFLVVQTITPPHNYESD